MILHKDRLTINPFNMTKKELLTFLTGRCKHRHKYHEHPACFIEEQNRQLRIGYLDIETTGFESDYHHILTYCIKVKNKNEYYTGTITKEDLDNRVFDIPIIKKLCADLFTFDVIYTYFGTKFDIPFMRGRAIHNGISFPEFGMVKHKDVYYMVKRLLKIHANRLEYAADFLKVRTKNHVDGEVWMLARLGDVKALKTVLHHNKLDCDDLEKVHKKLEAFDRGLVKSI